MLGVIIQTFLNIKHFKNVLPNIRHHDFTQSIRQLSRDNDWKSSIIFEFKRLNFLQDFELFLETLLFLFEFELFDDNNFFNNIWTISFNDVIIVSKFSYKNRSLTTLIENFVDLEIILMKDSISYLRMAFLDSCDWRFCDLLFLSWTFILVISSNLLLNLLLLILVGLISIVI